MISSVLFGWAVLPATHLGIDRRYLVDVVKVTSTINWLKKIILNHLDILNLTHC